MTAATLSPVDLQYANIKFGTANLYNGYTSNFGFNKLSGVILTTVSDSDVILGCAIASGAGTVSVIGHAGSAVTTELDVTYIAWGDR